MDKTVKIKYIPCWCFGTGQVWVYDLEFFCCERSRCPDCKGFGERIVIISESACEPQ